MTINDIKTMAQMKNEAQTAVLNSIDQIKQALQAFDGKSITGNKKRITDSIQAIEKGLYVSIDKGSFDYITLKIYYYPQNRAFKTESGYWHHIDSDFCVLWETDKTNIIDMAVIEARLDSAKQCYQKYIERTAQTADNIEEIAKQAEQLKQALSTLQYNSDTELTEAFNVRF